MRGKPVLAHYSCRDGTGGPGIRSCQGTVPNGKPIETNTLGQHTFTVTAISQDGQTRVRHVSYTVQ